jgi:hypothetical protein
MRIPLADIDKPITCLNCGEEAIRKFPTSTNFKITNSSLSAYKKKYGNSTEGVPKTSDNGARMYAKPKQHK